ncbi:6-pyruvoyltetrahydropterin/6-carboxytetrahydropterin synthase [Ardenticatena maritima]|uniref:6-carboxy-5,6,7,8-tetrahydropterin synthase n=1 Tax=Ardenticatena maritima TaxID=872965 RepID=A0A0M9UDA0_9CHLR|nr:6-carboxytetrahydropterin synthase [Ardenticatena maritima]GAP63787.1 6-pyruvoyltetrahydropterin/6-carboxytetrahydropterin synthase [Ardenticatena maritima]
MTLQPRIWTTKRFEFCASRQLWRTDWSAEQNRRLFGRLASPHGYGSNFTLFVTVSGTVNPDTGMTMNVVDLKQTVNTVLEAFDHRHLNIETPYFTTRPATLEAIADALADAIAPHLPPDIRLERLRLHEDEHRFAEWLRGDIRIGRRTLFSAAHRTASPHVSADENRARFGVCTRTHGHNYVLTTTFGGARHPEFGWLAHPDHLDTLVETVRREFDHCHLNDDLPYFRNQAATTETIVGVLFDRLREEAATLVPDIAVLRAELAELPDFRAATEGEPWRDFIREYTFSAAHRMANPNLSEAENRRLYGKCANPHGHGHSYRVVLTLRAPLDERWGIAADLVETDRAAQAVIEQVAFKRLDADIPFFQTHVATTENLLTYLWNAFAHAFGERLHHIAIWETPNNLFEYGRAPHFQGAEK